MIHVFRAKHDNIAESPIRTLYGRKGNVLLLSLDVCVLQIVDGTEEFRPVSEGSRLIAAPILAAGGGRLGLIAQYEWPPRRNSSVDPVVIVQLAPSASLKGVEDLRVIASLCDVGDRVFLDCGEAGAKREGVLRTLPDWHPYPDVAHRVKAHRVQFDEHLERSAHGAAVRLETGELIGMLIATQNQPSGGCRALVYPA